MTQGENDMGKPTDERFLRGDIELLGDQRGGNRKYYAMSVLDVLLEEEIITPAQRDYGLTYWRVKDAAFAFLGIAESPMYAETKDDEEEADADEDTDQDATLLAEEGRSAEVFMALCRCLQLRHRDVINACCTQACECSPFLVIHACGEGAIRQAFEALERLLPLAARDAEARIRTDAAKGEFDNNSRKA